MFEHRKQEILSRTDFLLRMSRSVGVTLLVITFSLGMGSAGYHHFEGLSWVDSLLNSSMILTGMGPVSELQTTNGKLFATFYCLYSGIAFLTIMAVMLAPVIHRALHRFHLDGEEG